MKGGHLRYLCLVLLAAVPAAEATDFVKARGRSFVVCNQPLRFVGYNLRGMCHYGRGEPLPYSSTSDVSVNLDFCVSTGAKVIRVFCPNRWIDRVETGNRLQTLLNACQARGIYVIVALTDMYLDTGLHPQGDSVYYTNSLLNHAFFAGGYTVNYLPQSVYLADRFKDHAAIFAWQIGNEIRDIGNPGTFATFAHEVVSALRAADPNHMIGTGLIDYGNAGFGYTQAVAFHADFDFVGTHNYNGGDTPDDALAAAMDKPYVVDEAGFDSSFFGLHRTPFTDADISKWVGRGASGYMNWGLMATNYDNGDGDRSFGIDRVFHMTDYSEYRTLFGAWAASLYVPPAPVSLQVAPESIDLTLPQGGSDVRTFTVSNTGLTPFPFTVSASEPWLSVQPSSGAAGCEPVSIQITINADGLPPIAHEGHVQVIAEGIAGSPRTITVTLKFPPGPGDTDGDGDVDQSDFGHIQLCLSGAGYPQLDEACSDAKFDSDHDVDGDDMTRFLGCMSGPKNPSNPSCLTN